MENYERENAFGESEVRLLTTVAASMGVALENARLFDETQRLLKETEQRDAELAVINSIQQGIAAELDFQAIVDLVGDKLREVFDTGDIGIRWCDERSRHASHYLYAYEHGKRLDASPPTPLDAGRPGRQACCDARSRSSSNNRGRGWPRSGMRPFPGTDPSQSSVMRADHRRRPRARHRSSLENYERENAFGESDVRLLQTVAASMGVALENARLFDETQRLFKESEQRAAELAIINSVQEGARRASSTSRRSSTSSATRSREIFGTEDMSIALLRPGEQHARRCRTTSSTASASRSSRCRSARGLTGARHAHARAAGHQREPPGARGASSARELIGDTDTADVAKSYLGVPILTGDEARRRDRAVRRRARARVRRVGRAPAADARQQR